MRETSELVVAFAQRVIELRKQHGWSQEVLAELAGLHRNYIGHVERVELAPCLVNVGKIAAAFGLSVSDMFDFPVATAQPHVALTVPPKNVGRRSVYARPEKGWRHDQ